jgi:hypothetical protein
MIDMNFRLITLTCVLAVLTLPAFAAKKKKAEAAPAAPVATPAAVATLTTYFCTIWHEITYDSAAAPVLAPVTRVPIPHMGNVAITKETGTRLPRPVDMWDDDEHEHAHPDGAHAHDFVKAPSDTTLPEGSYVLNWLDPAAGEVRYDFLTIREDHAGPIKPFFAGLGGNLYIGTCDQ